MCTESTSAVPEATNRSDQTRSVMNGASGAISRVSTSSVSCSVHSALGSPAQKRRRERRTYQFDRVSTNSVSAVPARSVSKSSSAWVTSVISAWVCEVSHRSSTGRSATCGRSPVGDQRFASAYRAWNDTAFQ